MMDFRTIVDVDQQENKIEYSSKLMFMGSCFANNIGSYFSEIGYNAMVNPFGILYNPISIAKAIDRLIKATPYSKDDLVFNNGLWQSFDHHGIFNKENKNQCLSGINNSLQTGSTYLKEADYLFITFGTAWSYAIKESKSIVANCHKFPSSHFNRFLTKHKIISQLYDKLINQLQLFNPNLKIILTVSPVRHWKDGAHGNQISKSILLLSIEEICEQFNSISYFPAYEILLDDLRDYRFFNSDMLHPSDEAIKYIRKKFMLAWMDQKCLGYLEDLEKINKAINHRPFNQQSEQHQKFLKKQLSKLNQLEKLYPLASFTSLKDTFSNKIC